MAKITSFYPVLACSNIAKSKEFYERLFGLEALFSSDWYAHLAHPEDKRVELALVAKDHDTIPLPGRTAAAGLLINFEVDDVDHEYDRLVKAGRVKCCCPSEMKRSANVISYCALQTGCSST